jgi:hypothetical protein
MKAAFCKFAFQLAL